MVNRYEKAIPLDLSLPSFSARSGIAAPKESRFASLAACRASGSWRSAWLALVRYCGDNAVRQMQKIIYASRPGWRVRSGHIYSLHAGGLPTMATTKKRGFASMSAALQREIASKGGRVAHERGTAHEFTREEAREAGRKGGKIAQARGTAHRFTSEQARQAGRKSGRRTRVLQASFVPHFGVARHEDTTIASEDEAWICSCFRPLPA